MDSKRKMQIRDEYVQDLCKGINNLYQLVSIDTKSYQGYKLKYSTVFIKSFKPKLILLKKGRNMNFYSKKQVNE